MQGPVHIQGKSAEVDIVNTRTMAHTVIPDAGLSADETVIELHVERAELQCATGADFASFVELDFFQHATQATPVMQGPRSVLMRPVLHVDLQLLAVLSAAMGCMHASSKRM